MTSCNLAPFGRDTYNLTMSEDTENMSNKQKLLNVKERCRICLADSGCMSDLFDDSMHSKINDLAKCTSVDIKHEQHLPAVVCHVCLYKLDMWSEFKEQFIQSNELLLSQLGSTEGSDTVVSKRKLDELDRSDDDNISDTDKKRPKSELPLSTPPERNTVDHVTDATTATLKQIYLSEDEPASSKDSSQKAQDLSDDAKCKTDLEKEQESNHAKLPLVPIKAKPLSTRRGKTTERRKASTKRWVARKKALLAATGETVSDTDSVASDDTQLSPVQKARAKTNADKEAERQRRLAKALKKLDTNMTDKYFTGVIKHDSDTAAVIDTDSDARRTRSQKFITESPQHDRKSLSEKQNKENVKENEMHSPSVECELSLENSVKNNKHPDKEEFTPHSVKSELVVGDATYIVTSTLIMAEPQYINKPHLNNLLKDSKSLNIDEGSQEKNTDIIDAVQLRRVHPVSTDASEKKFIERCLNIEVEGAELESLKRVQAELAGFVEKEMKNRLFGTIESDTKNNKSDCGQKSSYQTLDQQLKNIVERAIKKNVQNSLLREPDNVAYRKARPVSPALVKAAMTSTTFQPTVTVQRLDITEENQKYKINNAHLLEQHNQRKKSFGILETPQKRQSVPPAKYNDYTTSMVDSDSNLSDQSIPAIHRSGNVTKYGPASRKRAQGVVENAINTKFADVASKSSDYTTVVGNSQVTGQENAEIEANMGNALLTGEKHVCGTCSQVFNNHDEIELHMKSHKIEAVVPRHNKHKMMRCRRCHEVVEARFVKSHVCRSVKQVHKCYVCNCTFRTEKLLVRHLESHDQSEFDIENITKIDSKKGSTVSVSQNSAQAAGIAKAAEKSFTKSISKGESNRADPPIGKMVSFKGSKTDSGKGSDKPKETYTCFVCDKTFTDEEVLKDHLQKHCDDISEDEQSTGGKEQYQCAICGDSVESEDALEAHVEKHLFDDEDDNPNLISINSENEKKEVSYTCTQCSEVFNSEMLLEMHMQAHEEEAAIAEWEKQGMKAYEYQCMICDELFETEEELSEHLDVHNGNAHICQLCEKPFPSLEDLQKHVATH